MCISLSFKHFVVLKRTWFCLVLERTRVLLHSYAQTVSFILRHTLHSKSVTFWVISCCAKKCLWPVLHISEGGGYTRPGYGVGCYMKFDPCVNIMYWVFDDRKKIIKSKICIWLWVNFFVFYTFLCDLWFGHFEWFLIVLTVYPWMWHEIWSFCE